MPIKVQVYDQQAKQNTNQTDQTLVDEQNNSKKNNQSQSKEPVIDRKQMEKEQNNRESVGGTLNNYAGTMT